MNYTIANNTINIRIDDNFNQQNLSFFLDHLKLNSKNKHYLLNGKLIRRNREILNANSLLSKNDTISFPLYTEVTDNIEPYYRDLEIIYEDELFLVVNKPSGILVHTDNINRTRTLSNIVRSYYLNKNLNISVRPIHRLDVDTSGLIIFSKSELFQPVLDQLLMQKKISRYYYAITEGYIRENTSVVIDKPIGKNRHKSNEYIIYKNGKPAQTTIKSLKYNKKTDQTLVECKLKTGRTHQIRVHLLSIDHPIVNDPIYHQKSDKPMYLQAYKIKIYHPLLEKEIEIEIPLREDMQD